METKIENVLRFIIKNLGAVIASFVVLSVIFRGFTPVSGVMLFLGLTISIAIVGSAQFSIAYSETPNPILRRLAKMDVTAACFAIIIYMIATTDYMSIDI